MSGLRLFSFIAVILVCSLNSFGQDSQNSQKLLSPHNAVTFYEIARELYVYADPQSPEAQQAEVFFKAALELDNRADYITPDFVRFASQYYERDYSELVLQVLRRYVGRSSNLEVVRLAARYLLEHQRTLEQRIGILQKLIKALGEKNAVLSSELATEMALLTAEKANYPLARELLREAYYANPYNRLAFAKYNELIDKELKPSVYLRHLRFALRANPLDIEAALGFADYAESLGLYELAIDAYEYCFELFGYLHPSESLPPAIYLRWVRSCYNAEGKQNKCLQIAKDIRKKGVSDLYFEAITALAALKTGDKAQANRIFQSLNSLAEKQLGLQSTSSKQRPVQWAWFYCFAWPEPEKALAWANKAYADDPNSPMVTAILAYSLVMNKHLQLAEPFVNPDLSGYELNQVAALTMGLIQLAKQQKSVALEALKTAITIDAGSLEAHQARQLLKENGSDYIPLNDPALILQSLRDEFGKTIVPKFTPAGKILSVKLGTVGGTELSYGSRINANFVITNNWPEPFVIGDDGLVKGNIRLDAEVSGEVNEKIPNMVNFRFVPASPLESDKFLVIPLQINTGRFREVMRSFPQAAVEIKLKGYLDPVIDANGTLINCFPDVKPAELVIRRRPVKLSNRYLQNRLESLTKGKQGQKIISVKLFSGLLLEQYALRTIQRTYKITPTSELSDLLSSGLARALADSDWTIKLQSTAELMDVPLNYELTRALAGNLNDENWPVRLITLFLLGNSQGVSFEKVLDWTAEYDTNEYVRNMAVALGGKAPKQEPY